MPEGERRLEAVMFTDVVGYTALSQENERGAMSLLERQNELLRPVFARHRGREVKTIGDAFLVEFDSALAATECAIDIQDSIGQFNRHEGGARPLQVRIGIHVGDVIHSGGDIFGDAVNIASRVFPIADPGGICISEQVYVQVRNKVPYSMIRLQRQSLKNVLLPVDVYKVVLPSKAEVPQALEPVSAAAPPKRRVAVLPFDNISPDPADAFLAEGMTEELIAAISQVHELRVIARTSTARYRGTTKPVSEIGQELGAGSILEGSVRKAGNKVRITAQLIDSASEEHIWSESYERQLDDVFTIQREIAKSVSEALKVSLLSGEEARLSKKVTENPAAYVVYLKGRAAQQTRDEKGLKEARRLFEEAVARDPDYAMAWVGLADTYFLLGEYDYIPAEEADTESRDALSKALELDEDLPEARTSLANRLRHEYRFVESEAEYRRALALNPSYALGHHWYSICLWDMGRSEEARKEMLKAEELDPLSVVIAFNVAVALIDKNDETGSLEQVQKIRTIEPTNPFADLAMSFIVEHKGDYEGALAYQKLSLVKGPADKSGLARVGQLCGMTGREAEARDVLRKLEEMPKKRGMSFDMAVVHAGLGEKDETFRLLEKAFVERSLVYRALIYGHYQPGIKEDPRYATFFTRVGLPVPQE